MAKGMQKGNREVRKPKSSKPKEAAAPTSTFASVGGAKKGAAPKKGR